jgi:Sec-independent protein translocase protein TatA
MGLLELAVVFLVAFLVLGPGRSIDMARRTGKVLGDLRRSFNEVTDAISAEERQRSQPQQPSPGVPSRPDLPDYEPSLPDTDSSDGDAPPPSREVNGRQ